eukprot:jgi/Astpho2/5086/Aster-08022
MDHMDHGTAEAAVASPPGTIRHPTHGDFLGHVLPGAFFLTWGSYWLGMVFWRYLKATARAPFTSRAWHEFPCARARMLEPWLKICLTFIGITFELWSGEPYLKMSRLYGEDGRFVEHDLVDWQHSAMYLAFLLSGIVDLLCHYADMPSGIDHASLSMAVLVEGLLFAFHLQAHRSEGAQLDVRVHTLLVITILCTFVVIVGETCRPNSFLLAAARPMLIIMQGIWLVQVAHILYRDNMQWDPDYHGSAMFVPVVYVTWWMFVMVLSLTVFCGMKVYLKRQERTYEPLPVQNGAANGHAPINAKSFSHALELEAEPE